MTEFAMLTALFLLILFAIDQCTQSLMGEHMGKVKRSGFGQTGSMQTVKSRGSRFGLTKGQTMVEFAMVTPLFFLLLFSVIDYAWLLFAQMNVQQAVDDGGRYASTGQESDGTGSRISSIISTVQNEISVPGVNASNLQICSVPPGTTPGTGTPLCYNSTTDSGNTGAAGGPQYIVTLTLTTTLPLLAPLGFLGQFFPNAGYTFTSSSTFLNEPFNPSTTD